MPEILYIQGGLNIKIVIYLGVISVIYLVQKSIREQSLIFLKKTQKKQSIRAGLGRLRRTTLPTLPRNNTSVENVAADQREPPPAPLVLLGLIVGLVRTEPVEACSFLLLVAGVRAHAADRRLRGGRLHQLLIGGVSALVQQYVERFFVDTGLRTLDFSVFFVGGVNDWGTAYLANLVKWKKKKYIYTNVFYLWHFFAMSIEHPAAYFTGADNIL